MINQLKNSKERFQQSDCTNELGLMELSSTDIAQVVVVAGAPILLLITTLLLAGKM